MATRLGSAVVVYFSAFCHLDGATVAVPSAASGNLSIERLPLGIHKDIVGCMF